MTSSINISIILIGTQNAENIGSVARAMANCHFHNLVLVSPLVAYTETRSMAAAMGGFDYISPVTVKNDLISAIQDLEIVYATTNRIRAISMEYLNLENAVLEIVQEYCLGTKIGIVFGPEQSGLDNQSMMHCTKAITIELNKDFCSLNLSQAVLLVVYNIFQALRQQLHIQRVKNCHLKLANIQEIDAMIMLLKNNISPDRKNILLMLNVLQHFFIRTRMTQMEIRSLFGIVKDILKNKIIS